MNSRFLAQHFTVNISKFQLPRKGVKSQLSRSSCMYMACDVSVKICLHNQNFHEYLKGSDNCKCAFFCDGSTDKSKSIKCHFVRLQAFSLCFFLSSTIVFKNAFDFNLDRLYLTYSIFL